MKMSRLIFFLLLSLPGYTQEFRFDFGGNKPADGFRKVGPNDFYSPSAGFGWMKGSMPVEGKGGLNEDFITSHQSLFFTVDIPEGNYAVRILFGENAETTVKVENRRLMAERVITPSGRTISHDFTISVRSPFISGTDSIRLKPREYSYLQWDKQLTFEFSGKKPSVARLEIRPETKAKTIFLAGNSTVVDQALEPYSSWGQMIPAFFEPGKVVIANYAESGESIRSFVSERRLQKIMSMMKEGDYLFMEFAHNDQKIKDFEAFGIYSDFLRRYIDETRHKGGIPVLVTSMPRRSFDSDGKISNTLGDFPEAMRKVASEKEVILIDLNQMAKVLWESLGPERSKLAFVHYPAGSFPGQDKDLADDTHFNNYGAYQLARCVAEGIRKEVPELSGFLKRSLKPFSPDHPDDPAAFDFPISPVVEIIKPDGN